MTKLEKWLIKVSNNKIIEAKTTYSKYYYIGYLKIRVSDHFSFDTDADICITIPLNGGTKYCVSVPNSQMCFLWTAKQIIDFVNQFMFYKQLVTKNNKTIEHKLELNTDNLEFNKKLTLKDICNFPKDYRALITKSNSIPFKGTDMILLENVLNIQFNTNCILSEDFKRFLLAHPMTVRKAALLYKIIIIDNKKEFTEELGTSILKVLD